MIFAGFVALCSEPYAAIGQIARRNSQSPIGKRRGLSSHSYHTCVKICLHYFICFEASLARSAGVHQVLQIGMGIHTHGLACNAYQNGIHYHYGVPSFSFALKPPRRFPLPFDCLGWTVIHHPGPLSFVAVHEHVWLHTVHPFNSTFGFRWLPSLVTTALWVHVIFVSDTPIDISFVPLGR